MIPSYEHLRKLRRRYGAPWFTGPFDLNLVVGRSGEVGRWDDLVLVACLDDVGRELVEAWPATGDAWEGEWTAPSHASGCLYTLDQHVPGGMQLGTFKGRVALRQVRSFRYVRWPPSRGRVPTVAELRAEPAFEGLRGTHLHGRVSGKAPAKPAPDDSEGCAVMLYQHHLASLEALVMEQDRRHGTDVVSPTFCQLSEL